MELPGGPLAGQGRDVEDLAAARGTEVLDGGHRDLPGAEDVDVEDPPPDLGRGRLEVVVGDDLGGAGVVDQDVEPTVAVDHLVHQSRGLVLVGHVGLDVAGVGQLVGQRLAGLHRRRRVDHHGGPERGEPVGGGRPDPRRRAGDQHHLAAEDGSRVAVATGEGSTMGRV